MMVWKTSILVLMALPSSVFGGCRKRGETCGASYGGNKKCCFPNGCLEVDQGIGLWECVNQARHLVDSDETAVDSAEARVLESCAATTYALALYVSDHVELLAIPSTLDKHSSDCQPIVFGDHSNSDSVSGKALTIVANDDEKLLHIVQERYGNSYPLGNYELSLLVDAYSDADHLLGREYNVLVDNCATFVLSMVKALGITATDSIKSYAAKRLAQSSIPNYVRAEENYSWLIEDSSDNAALMRRLVDFYVDSKE